LQDLLVWSRSYNAQRGLTGLLLYSETQFVQVIEGDESAVRHLYDRIRQDGRHHHVTTLSEGPEPHRWFADWQMAAGYLESITLRQLLDVVEVGRSPLLPFDDPHVQTLVAAFERST
jgi:hypothetical protein